MLDGDQIQKLRLTLAGDGWNHVMKPLLLNRGRAALKALVLTRSERATEFAKSDFDTDDEVLRAMIRDSEWMVTCWDNEVAVYEHNRRLDELDGASPTGGEPALKER